MCYKIFYRNFFLFFGCSFSIQWHSKSLQCKTKQIFKHFQVYQLQVCTYIENTFCINCILLLSYFVCLLMFDTFVTSIYIKRSVCKIYSIQQTKKLFTCKMKYMYMHQYTDWLCIEKCCWLLAIKWKISYAQTIHHVFFIFQFKSIEIYQLNTIANIL